MKKVIFIVILILILDQASKIWVKTHMGLGDFITVFPDWFFIRFVENPGIAYGRTFGGDTGKVILTLLRIVLIGFIIAYISKTSKQFKTNYFLIPMAFVLGGAIGNVVDSVFYGLIFNTGTTWNGSAWVGYSGISELSTPGYSGIFMGCVVDMLHFPMFEFNWPSWIPIIGGEHFVFFSPIFNIADSAITIGAIGLLLFSGKAFRLHK